jgi:hypothetical protein
VKLFVFLKVVKNYQLYAYKRINNIMVIYAYKRIIILVRGEGRKYNTCKVHRLQEKRNAVRRTVKGDTKYKDNDFRKTPPNKTVTADQAQEKTHE